jgi:hypothetical protein
MQRSPFPVYASDAGHITVAGSRFTFLRQLWRATACCLSALLLAPFAVAQVGDILSDFTPPPDSFDWVQLDSGEWLKGEVLSLYDSQLYFDSDHFGELTLDWDDVARLRGGGMMRIGLEGGVLTEGRLRIDTSSVMIEGDERTLSLSRDVVVAITPYAAREIDNWSLDVSLGVNARGGNTDILEYNLSADAERRTVRSRHNLSYLGNVSENDGERVASNARLTGSWDVFRGGDFFWRPLNGQYYQDAFQNIDYQLSLESGAGYHIYDTSRTEWTVSAGAGVNIVRYNSSEEGQERANRSPSLTVISDFDTELTPWLDYSLLGQATVLEEDSGALQTHVVTTLSAELTGRLDLDISFVWDRIQNPQTRADGTVPKRDDYRVTLGLGFEF